MERFLAHLSHEKFIQNESCRNFFFNEENFCWLVYKWELLSELIFGRLQNCWNFHSGRQFLKYVQINES